MIQFGANKYDAVVFWYCCCSKSIFRCLIAPATGFPRDDDMLSLWAESCWELSLVTGCSSAGGGRQGSLPPLPAQLLLRACQSRHRSAPELLQPAAQDLDFKANLNWEWVTFRCRMTAQELTAEQLGHLCGRGGMDCAEEQLSKRGSVGVRRSERWGSDGRPALCRQSSAKLWWERAAGALASHSLEGSLTKHSPASVLLAWSIVNFPYAAAGIRWHHGEWS